MYATVAADDSFLCISMSLLLN